jgi:type I restriction enzyme S subunit
LFDVINGGTPTSEPENWDGDVPWATPVDLGRVNGGRLGETLRTLTKEGLKTGSSLVPAGSLVVSTRAPIGYVAETTTAMAFNQGCRGLSPRAELDVRYFRYQLSASTEQLQALGQGSTFAELSTDSLRSFLLAAPSAHSQRAIADYLDSETTRMDKLVALRRRGQETLSELRRSVLDDAFGSDETEVWRLKHLLAQPPCYGVLVPRFSDDGVPFVRVGDIEGIAMGVAPALAIEPSLSEEYGRTKLHAGDVVLSVVGSVDKVAVVPPAIVGANVARAVCRLVPQRGVPSELLALWLQSSAYLSQAAAATGADSAQPTLGMGDLANFVVQFPRSDIAREFHKRLERRLKHIAELDATASRHVDLLQERRQALITAAVTGQLEIPGVAA